MDKKRGKRGKEKEQGRTERVGDDGSGKDMVKGI